MISNSKVWEKLPTNTKRLIERFQAQLPVDIRGLAKALGVPVKAATLSPNISGEIRPDGYGGFTIRVSRHDSPARQRYTVAHELAHYLLHQALIGNGITDDALFRSNQSDGVEREADKLAADILMPAQIVQERKGNAVRLGVEDLTASLAQTFEVSPQAMRIRLEG